MTDLNVRAESTKTEGTLVRTFIVAKVSINSRFIDKIQQVFLCNSRSVFELYSAVGYFAWLVKKEGKIDSLHLLFPHHLLLLLFDLRIFTPCRAAKLSNNDDDAQRRVIDIRVTITSFDLNGRTCANAYTRTTESNRRRRRREQRGLTLYKCVMQ